MRFEKCPRCRHPMCEIDKVLHCLHCGYSNAETVVAEPPRYRRFVIDQNKELAEIAHRNLLANLDGSLSYCQKRGMALHTIERWNLGYIPAKYRDKPEFWQELWGRRIFFPILSADGNAVIGFGGRKIDLDDRAKYVNSSESQEYEKRKNLYGFWLLPEKTDVVYLCEGYVDVISMDSHGYAYAVASLGTSLTEEQAQLLYGKANSVVIAYDADEPGRIATTRAIGILRAAGFKVNEISVLNVQGAKDVDEALNNGGNLKQIGVADFYEMHSMWEALANLVLEGGVA